MTDNHKINEAAMDIMCNGEAIIRTPHPADSSKEIYLSYDQSHVIKNVISHFLAKDFRSKQVSSKYVKELYWMQKHFAMRPVIFLTRKHVYPSNIEKMDIRLLCSCSRQQRRELMATLKTRPDTSVTWTSRQLGLPPSS